MDLTINASHWKKARLSGSLNLSGKELKSVPSDAFHLNEHLGPDEKFWECMDLVKMDLSHNKLVSLPDEFHCVVTLIELLLPHNNLKGLPPSITTLAALKKLDVSHNEIAALPAGLCELRGLVVLNVSHNKLRDIPDSLHCMAYSLEVFRCEFNLLTSVPSIVYDRRHSSDRIRLLEVALNNNEIAALPEGFGSTLADLTVLELSNNLIEALPVSFGGLNSLKALDLRYNRLRVSNVVLPKAKSLDRVFLGFNSLRSVDATDFRSLPLLSHLDLSNNQLTELPDSIGYLVSLKVLDLTNNNIANLPPVLGYMKNLGRLLLEGNPLKSIRRTLVTGDTSALKKYLATRGPYPLTEVPAALVDVERPVTDGAEAGILRSAVASGVLVLAPPQASDVTLSHLFHVSLSTTVHQLDLSGCKLKSLPEEVEMLQALKVITLSKNELESLPLAIASLPQLTELRAAGNRLSSRSLNTLRFPASHLPPLRIVDLSQNNLTFVPTWVWNFESTLTDLCLSYNAITNSRADDSMWPSLRGLALLDLSNNKLDSVPSALVTLSSTMPKLSTLNLENNELRSIPYELGLCDRLKVLKLAGNPQRTVRQDILTQPADRLLEYLRNKLPASALRVPVAARVAVPEAEEEELAPAVPSRHRVSAVAADVSGSARSAPRSEARSLRGDRGAYRDELPVKRPVVEASPTVTAFASAKYLESLDAEIADLQMSLEDPTLSRSRAAELQKMLRRTRADRARIAMG